MADIRTAVEFLRAGKAIRRPAASNPHLRYVALSPEEPGLAVEHSLNAVGEKREFEKKWSLDELAADDWEIMDAAVAAAEMRARRADRR